VNEIPETVPLGKPAVPKVLPGIGLLLIMHGVGLWGMLLSEEPQYFARLTPVNLLVCGGVLAAFHQPWNRKFGIFAAAVFALGFLVEVLGVKTGWPFGEYRYGQALGLQLAEVPLLIGLNWLLLTYCSGLVITGLVRNHLARIFVAAALMVAMDYLIEPVAVKFDFWSWDHHQIPIGNYLGWFAVAVLQQILYQRLAVNSSNRLAAPLLIIQAVFFFVLILSI
jgi:uncharacterized membrane protein